MKGVNPIPVTDAILTSTTVAEPSANESAWSATDVYGVGDAVVLGTSSSTVTISNGSPAVVTSAANNLGVGTPVAFTVSVGGALPTGLTAAQVYYLLQRIGLNAFVVSDAINGAPIVTSSAGSGTFTCTAYPHRKYTSSSGATGTGVTCTSATPAVVTWVSHGRAANDAIVFTNAGTLPTGVTAGTVYYVLSTGLTADTFQFSTSPGGTAVNTTTPGSGMKCGLALTYNKPPALNPNVWTDSGASNKLACFDLYRNNATAGASPMTQVITPGQRVDALGVIGAVATQAQVSITSATYGGSIYSRTVSLVTRSVANAYEYCFKPFTFLRGFALFDLPPVTDAVITVTLTDPAGRVQMQDLIIGMQTELGDVLNDAECEAIGVSTVTRDSGNIVMTSKTGAWQNDYTLRIDSNLVDSARSFRKAVDGKPALWAGITNSSHVYYGSLLQKATFRSFKIKPDTQPKAEMKLQLEDIGS